MFTNGIQEQRAKNPLYFKEISFACLLSISKLEAGVISNE